MGTLVGLSVPHHIPVLRSGLYAVFDPGPGLCAASVLALWVLAVQGEAARVGYWALCAGNFGAGSILRILVDGTSSALLVLANTNVAALLDLGD